MVKDLLENQTRIILRKSVEYIKHLQALVEKQEAKNKELEEELEKLKQK